MRVPKFRAWVKAEKIMLPVGEIDFDYEFAYLEEENGYRCERDFDEIEFMQSADIYDIHGTEAFDGDIVKIPEDYDKFGRNAGEILKVVFDNGCFRLKRPNSKGRGFYFEDDNTVTIIGNIYENPELLGE